MSNINMMPIKVSEKSEARLWAKVNKNGPNGCWIWTSCLNRKGYGRFRMNSRLFFSHRVAYTLCVGTIPDGLQLDHLCRVPACCNPSHLEAVTCRENVRRGLVSEAAIAMHAKKTHCPSGHEYSESNTYWGKQCDGKYHVRICRACNRDRARDYQARKRADIKAAKAAALTAASTSIENNREQ